MVCTDRCKNAKARNVCHCSCHGVNHAKHNDNKCITDKEMTIRDGGEVAEFIQQWQNILIQCFGVCHKNQLMNKFMGYSHDGGLADAKGEKWWVYFECPNCRYGHSFNKMKFFQQHTKIEIQAEYEKNHEPTDEELEEFQKENEEQYKKSLE